MASSIPLRPFATGWWLQACGNPNDARPAVSTNAAPERPCRGELIQIDGSPHDWFEDRGPRCCLIVFIDDATGELGALRFVPVESTQAYMETLADYLDQHGRPVALYSDRHSIFRVNNPKASGNTTQFTRALQTLDIGAIHANTPQAKGRVERANQTLQDRLVKELRLNNIQTLKAANRFLPKFIQAYNQRFAKPPQSPTDAHRPVLHNSKELQLILAKQYTRTLSKNLTCQLKRVPDHQQRQRISATGASDHHCPGLQWPNHHPPQRIRPRPQSLRPNTPGHTH